MLYIDRQYTHDAQLDMLVCVYAIILYCINSIDIMEPGYKRRFEHLEGSNLSEERPNCLQRARGSISNATSALHNHNLHEVCKGPK
jgi:hypothetical protein